MADTKGVRRPRWAVPAVVVVVALLAAAVLGLPRLVDDDEPAVSRATACVAHTDVTVDGIDGGEARQARWVRFCPVAESLAQRVRHPQGVVTDELAGSVADTLWQTQADRPVCGRGSAPAGPTGHFRIEVGLADGRVAELAGDTGCSTRDVLLFSQLETTLLMEAAAAADPSGTVPAPVRCPSRLTTAGTDTDGASADQLVDTAEEERLSTVPLLPLPAVTADVCAYFGRGRGLRLVDQWQAVGPEAETIRSTATLAHDRGARTDCQVDPTRTSYVVVLADATGTARPLTVDGAACGVLHAAIGAPPREAWLGLARERLLRTIARTRPPAAAG